MKASEFVDRINELIKVVGDVDILIEGYSERGWTFYGPAFLESQYCRRVVENQDQYTDMFDKDDKVVNIIKVF